LLFRFYEDICRSLYGRNRGLGKVPNIGQGLGPCAALCCASATHNTNRAKVVASTTPGRSQTRDPGALQRSARQLNNNFRLNHNTQISTDRNPRFPPHHSEIMPSMGIVSSKESYGSVESRIQKAITELLRRNVKSPNLAAAAREFDLPPQQFRARWNGRGSKEKRV